MQRAAELIDEEDWTDLEPSKPQGVKLADVTVTVSEPGERPSGKVFKAKARINFREDAAVWMENQTRFRIQIGGASANMMRFIPDNNGPYETGLFKGVSFIRLGSVSAWPAEKRAPTAASWKVEGGAMVVELPADWAKPRG